MEWVETTGRTVDEAKDAALDELGVDEADAEFEVVAEPQTGLFGRLRAEARVRARVRPTAPRAKEDRRDRRRGGAQGRGGPGGTGSAPATGRGSGSESTARSASPGPADSATGSGDSAPESGRAAETPGEQDSGEAGGPGRRRRPRSRNRAGSRPSNEDLEPKEAQVEVALEEQARIAEGFLADLTAQFGLSASVKQTRPDDETVEIQLSGADLGILIGPKGSTLVALQHLTRTVVHHETGATNGHLNVDVGGYRHKRSEALARFATQVAATVKESGNRTALEPMTAVDRKVVHDTIHDIEGVVTISEGEEPRRRVVVMPAPSGD